VAPMQEGRYCVHLRQLPLQDDFRVLNDSDTYWRLKDFLSSFDLLAWLELVPVIVLDAECRPAPTTRAEWVSSIYHAPPSRRIRDVRAYIHRLLDLWPHRVHDYTVHDYTNLGLRFPAHILVPPLHQQ